LIERHPLDLIIKYISIELLLKIGHLIMYNIIIHKTLKGVGDSLPLLELCRKTLLTYIHTYMYTFRRHFSSYFKAGFSSISLHLPSVDYAPERSYTRPPHLHSPWLGSSSRWCPCGDRNTTVSDDPLPNTHIEFAIIKFTKISYIKKC
jgi:hypothetical protein